MMTSYGWSHLSVTLLFAATVAAIRAARGMPDSARRPAWISALLGLVGGGVMARIERFVHEGSCHNGQIHRIGGESSRPARAATACPAA